MIVRGGIQIITDLDVFYEETFGVFAAVMLISRRVGESFAH